jgi:uncharacterized membrane protein
MSSPGNAKHGSRSALVPVALAVLLVSNSAYAYVDPGTGSILLQGLIAAVAAGIGYVAMYWQRVKAFFGRRGPSEAGDPRDEHS